MTQQADRAIITGLSGAGMSSVLKTLEDLGYEVFDNFPVGLADTLVNDSATNGPIAIGIDTRSRGFEAKAVIDTAQRLGARLIFLTCDDAELQRRFTETRRRHPMAKDRPVHVGIEQEHKLLEPFRAAADLVIDTTTLRVPDLRHILEGHFGEKTEKTLTVTLLSFGFKRGLPREADIVMDVRFLKNPHWVPELKPLSGKDKAVGDYIEADPDFSSFMENFKTLLEPLLKRYAEEGKSYLTIAVGCTGGRHRSVYVIENLAGWMRE
ncbi:MAG: RNase adapter RapZ [Alphaproteobacteria bacterium]|nr:RNase adapter RapZ [Alphaproteobacteria bacterium]